MRYGKIKKRFLSIALVAVMMVGLLPAGIAHAQGHTHSEDCYAQGGELICGEEDATTFSSDQDYADIKAILTQDASISFDPDTQTFLVIDVDAVQSEHLASLNIYQAEERIKEHELTFDVSINDTPVGNGQTYYLISQEDNTIETAAVSDAFKIAANSGKAAVFILDKGKTYSVSYDKRVEEVYGGDKLLYQNVFTGNPTGSTGSLTISKKVIGTGTPDADTLFEFTVTKDGAAAVGQYSVDGGATQTIPADGKISLKGGQSAVLTGLEPGEYIVTETSPSQANYKSTSFSVNNGEVQNGLSATVTVTGAAAETTGGWSKKDGMPVQDTDGMY